MHIPTPIKIIIGITLLFVIFGKRKTVSRHRQPITTDIMEEPIPKFQYAPRTFEPMHNPTFLQPYLEHPVMTKFKPQQPNF